MVLFPDELKVSRSLRKARAKGAFETRFDTAFARGDGASARRRATGSRGPGSSRRWSRPTCACTSWASRTRSSRGTDGELAGGLYGILLGRVFFGESMFARETDASKVALVKLVERAARRSACALIDCQQATRHLASLGAREIPRREFAQLLAESIQYPPSGSRWPATEEAWRSSTTSR